MTPCKGPIALGRAVLACLVLLLAALACQPVQPRDSNAEAAGRTPSTARTSTGPSHDLAQDETAGGHTLHKHIGRTDEQLSERLRDERNISAASTWSDRATAERAVALALEQNREKINHWLNWSGGHPNLVVDYEGNREHPIGRSLRRGADRAEPCAHAAVVLKWAGPYDYYVLTSYPECRE